MTRTEIENSINTAIVANGTGAISAEVLNPILLGMVGQINDLTGDLEGSAVAGSDIVEMLNALKSALSAVSAPTVHTGTNTPLVSPPSSVSQLDYFAQLAGAAVISFWQFTGSEWVQLKNWINDSEISDETTWSSAKIVNFVNSKDELISVGAISISSGIVTIPAGAYWRINGVLYSNASAVNVPIASASSGMYRTDLLVANESSGFDLIAGVESPTYLNPPVPPINTVSVMPITVYGGEVSITPPTTDFSVFKKKSESSAYNDLTLSGSDAVIQFQPNGESVYAFSNAGLVSIDGFGLDLITGNPSAEVPYPGKDIFIFNNKSGNLTLKHDGSGTAQSKFFFIDETDLIIPPGGKVWLKYGPSYCEMIFKSWIDVDLSSKADLVGGKVPASQLPAYVDDVLEFANLAAFPVTGESGKIYVALDTNFTYRWGGSVYVKISDSNKLDKSTTASSVYGTDASGLQTMIPLSELGGDLKVLHKNHVSGISVVNNPNFTYKYAYGVLIPGGTIQVGDFIDIEVSFEKVSGGNAELYPRIGINTINGSAGEIVISFSVFTSSNVYAKIQRSLVVKATALTEILHHGTNSVTSWNAAATSGSRNINWSTDKYVIISIANNGASALDATWRVSSIIITKK